MKEKMARRGEPPTGYMTASTAKRLLGNISDGRLRSLITQKKIERYVPPGMQQGFYSSKDVQNFIREMDEFNLAEREKGPRFFMATKEDMTEIVNFMIEQFGGGNTAERRLSWLARNPEIAFIERNPAKSEAKGKVVGCVFAIPLTPEKINQLLTDATASTQLIEADDVQPYQTGNPAYVFIASMAVSAKTGRMTKRHRGATMIRGLLKFFNELGERGVEIRTLAARSDTEDGINLLRSCNFTEITSNTGYKNFLINMRITGNPLMARYKRAIQQWKQEHGETVETVSSLLDFIDN